MIVFEKETIYDTVGIIINALKQCRQKNIPKGDMQYHFLCKIYDQHANMVAEYTHTQEDVFKAITKKMHEINNGSVECICHPHPKLI